MPEFKMIIHKSVDADAAMKGCVILTVIMIAMLTTVIAMVIGMKLSGVEVGITEIMFFSIFDLAAICCLIFIMRNIKEERGIGHGISIGEQHSPV